MATITEVRWIERKGRRKPAKYKPGTPPPARTPSHAELELDGERWLTLPKRWLKRHDLYEGRELDEASLASLEAEVVEKLGIFISLRVLEGGAKTRKQLNDKLERYGLPEHLRERSLEKVDALGFLEDESEIAASICRSSRNHGYWRGRAAQKIRQRGIPAEIADLVLDEHFPSDEEADAASDALPVRLHSDPRKGNAFLVRRGFSFGAAQTAYARLDVID
jgi:SOS response regulatory protein OraA/RecX